MRTDAHEEVDLALTMDEVVGRRVHQLMWDQKVTQVMLGRMIGMDQSSVAKRLRGSRGWSLDDIKNTAAALGVTVAYLFGEEGFKPTTPAKSQPSDYSADHRAPVISLFGHRDLAHVAMAH